VDLTSYAYLVARDCLASNDRVIVDDEFIRETERKIILKHNKMVNKVKSTLVIMS
jgi:predicted kinase